MKKASLLENDLPPEYDFASMSGGVRGKYVERLRRESNIVVLEPEVAEAFPTGEASISIKRLERTAEKHGRSAGGR